MRWTPKLSLPLVLLPASSSSMVSTSENYQNVSLPSHCRSRCGNISVPYPFGIDRGCSRPGFNLTCVYQYRRAAPAQLYLGDGVFEVTEIDVGNSQLRAKLPVYTMDLGVDSMSFRLSDALPSRRPYAIYTSSSVFVHGCNVVASIVDLANNSAVIDYCYTFCLEFDSSQSVRYCKISKFPIIIPLPSFVVKLTRIKRTDNLPLRNSTSIKAFVSGDDDPSDDLILQVVTSHIAHVEVLFSWYMGDYASCDVASKDPNKTYACLSEFSQCNELDTNDGRSVGYWCQCNASYDGNPYQRNGCSLAIDIPILSPAANCSRKCGTVEIPFPFGLDSGCYRGENFALVCNATHNPPILSFGDSYNISEILLEEGKLRLTKPFVYDTYPFTFFANQLASWVIDEQTCAAAKKNRSSFACVAANSVCLDNARSSEVAAAGYYCKCKDGYRGNPYLEGGCKDIDECKLPGKCYGLCNNTNGSFSCTCQPGTIGDPLHGPCIPDKKKNLVIATDIATLSPTANCSRKCGTVDIPFPFGLDSGCYRGERFALVCNTTHNPPDLSFGDSFNISEIQLEEGKLRIPKPFVSSTYPFTFFANQLASWVIDEQTCAVAKKNRSSFACVAANSECLYNTKSSEGSAAGYHCKCKDGYRGNPYLEGGCEDIDECKLPGKCYGHCTNTNGSFICTCRPGTIGDPLHGQCIPDKKKNLVIGIIIGASTGIGILLLSIVVAISIRTWKIRKQFKAKENHFRQNHGLLLQQLISSSESTAARTRIFSLEEIEKATNNFDETRVVGRGGHGTVYKGILSDQRVVAIKRSKHMKQSEIDQFINEVAILSQINHRNVVKLFGCCLETQVPLLIYEFISNGTLSDHLHVPNGKSTLSWDDRLRIATEAAGSLAYLHSAASISIFHRDVKSSNILLDDHFIAKVSDFGASRFIPLDQTHVVTAIQGTFGYLDPEYYQTSQLTEKSDVYSFGVILLELLTGKKPIYLAEGDTAVNLSIQFLEAVRQNQSFDLVEDGIMEEGAKEELGEIIHLIETCLRLKGAERPTMKEVECKLQDLRRIRMRKRGYCIGEGNAGDQYFPTASCYPPCESIDQTRQGATRNCSLERELMWSQSFPR